MEWADGEWIQDPETGENMWQPADGSDAISEADYYAQAEAAADADDASDLGAGRADDDAEDAADDQAGARDEEG